jgi:hypothetical protein
LANPGDPSPERAKHWDFNPTRNVHRTESDIFRESSDIHPQSLFSHGALPDAPCIDALPEGLIYSQKNRHIRVAD